MEPVFIITKHPYFMSMNCVVNKTTVLSRNARSNKGHKKVKGFTFEDKMKISNHSFHQIDFETKKTL
jgi:hypothetical protein